MGPNFSLGVCYWLEQRKAWCSPPPPAFLYSHSCSTPPHIPAPTYQLRSPTFALPIWPHLLCYHHLSISSWPIPRHISREKVISPTLSYSHERTQAVVFNITQINHLHIINFLSPAILFFFFLIICFINLFILFRKVILKYAILGFCYQYDENGKEMHRESVTDGFFFEKIWFGCPV